jgi:hypothetical protein
MSGMLSSVCSTLGSSDRPGLRHDRIAAGDFYPDCRLPVGSLDDHSRWSHRAKSRCSEAQIPTETGQDERNEARQDIAAVGG